MGRLVFVILLGILAVLFTVPSYPRQRLLAEWQAYHYFKQLSPPASLFI